MSIWICQNCKVIQGFSEGMACSQCGAQLHVATIGHVTLDDDELARVADVVANKIARGVRESIQ